MCVAAGRRAGVSLCVCVGVRVDLPLVLLSVHTCTADVTAATTSRVRTWAAHSALLVILRALAATVGASSFGETVAAMATASAVSLGERVFDVARSLQLCACLCAVNLASARMSEAHLECTVKAWCVSLHVHAAPVRAMCAVEAWRAGV